MPVLEKVRAQVGVLPEKTTADNGYFSAEAVEASCLSETDLYVAVGKEKSCDHLEPGVEGSQSPEARMRAKLKTDEGWAVYKMRKAIVEPVFGQIKEVRHFRQFSLRGLEKVTAEWDLVALTHNLLKLYRCPLSVLFGCASRDPMAGNHSPPGCRRRGYRTPDRTSFGLGLGAIQRSSRPYRLQASCLVSRL